MKTAWLIFMVCVSALRAEELRLHFKPDDHALGDVHPFFHEGEYFLYYLKPGKFDALLVRSRDSLNWTSQTLTHAPVTPEDWMTPYFVLGVFRDESAGLFRSFHGHAKGRMASQTSTDLIHWECAAKEFHVPAEDYYERRRDPFVFWISEKKCYGCVMTTWIKGRAKSSGGGISLATSPDLKRWTDHGIVLDLVDQDEPECPQMFQIGTRWYLLTSIYHRKSVGGPVYYTASRPEGPWSIGGKLDGKDLCAAQVARDGSGRFMLYGWIPLTPATAEKQHWGGHLALAREVYALPDGSLATRLAPEIAKTIDKLVWMPASVAAKVPLKSSQRFGARCKLSCPPGGQGGFELCFPPLGKVVYSTNHLCIQDASGVSWSESELVPPPAGSWDFSVLIEDDRVEVFAAGRHSLCARLPAAKVPPHVSFHATGDLFEVTDFQFSLLQSSP
jgi:sucrose-6-phosphate hydrolase SacC (GH32 family)